VYAPSTCTITIDLGDLTDIRHRRELIEGTRRRRELIRGARRRRERSVVRAVDLGDRTDIPAVDAS
jgi:hypothetical protein